MFWSGADFDKKHLNILGKKFKDVSIVYNSVSEIITFNFREWAILSF